MIFAISRSLQLRVIRKSARIRVVYRSISLVVFRKVSRKCATLRKNSVNVRLQYTYKWLCSLAPLPSRVPRSTLLCRARAAFLWSAFSGAGRFVPRCSVELEQPSSGRRPLDVCRSSRHWSVELEQSSSARRPCTIRTTRQTWGHTHTTITGQRSWVI